MGGAATEGSYQPDATHRWTSQGTIPTVARITPGLYRVSLPGLGMISGAAFVTSTGGGIVSCAIRGSGQYAPANVIEVECYNTQSGPADGPFTLAFVGWAATT